MTATLTIKAEAAGALSVLDRVNSLIDASVKGSERLAAITGTIRGHWKAIGDDVASAVRTIGVARGETERIAVVTKAMNANFLSSVGVVQKLGAELKTVRDQATATARIANSIRLPAAGRSAASVGGTFTGSSGGVFGPRSPSPVPFDRIVGDVRGAVTAPSSAGGGSSLGSLAGLAGGPVGAAAGLVTSTIGKALELAWQGFKTGALAVSATAATIVGNSVRLALKAEPIEQGFGSLTRSNGLGDQTKVLEDLREAARGTVSDLQLMTNANAALQLGAAKTVPELQILIEGGRRLGKAMGRDATEGFNDLALGIGRQSKLILDNLGIIVNADQVYEDYAKSVGSTTEKISDQEKKLAFVAAAYDAVQKKMRDLGEEQITAGEKVEKFKASFSNLSVQLGNQLLPAIGAVADNWASFLRELDGDKVAGEMKGAIDAVKGAAGSVLDYIFPKDIAEDFGTLGASVWQAFTDPSTEAFRIVGLEVKKMLLDVETQFETLFDNLLNLARIGDAAVGHSVGAAAKSVGLERLGSFIQKRSLAQAGEAAAAAGATAAENKSASIPERARIEEQISGLKRDAEQRRAARAAEREAERARLASTGAGDVNGPSSNAAAQAAARAEREASEAATRAKTEAEKESARVMREEIAVRESVISAIEAESRGLFEIVRDLDGARKNAAAALSGRADPNKSLSSALDENAKSLRSFPGIFETIGVKIREQGQSIADSIRDGKEAIDGALKQISDGLRRQANEFLQSDPQDGETVRVRAAKRRARKELQRSNTDLINGAFRSEGVSSFSGNFGGFGAQDVERSRPSLGFSGNLGIFGTKSESGNILDRQFPQLERALERLRSPDGSTQVSENQARISAIVGETADRIAEGKTILAALLKEQSEAHTRQAALSKDTNELIAQAVKMVGERTKDIIRNETEIGRLKAELKKLEQAARK